MDGEALAQPSHPLAFFFFFLTQHASFLGSGKETLGPFTGFPCARMGARMAGWPADGRKSLFFLQAAQTLKV